MHAWLTVRRHIRREDDPQRRSGRARVLADVVVFGAGPAQIVPALGLQGGPLVIAQRPKAGWLLQGGLPRPVGNALAFRRRLRGRRRSAARQADDKNERAAATDLLFHRTATVADCGSGAWRASRPR